MTDILFIVDLQVPHQVFDHLHHQYLIYYILIAVDQQLKLGVIYIPEVFTDDIKHVDFIGLQLGLNIIIQDYIDYSQQFGLDFPILL